MSIPTETERKEIAEELNRHYGGFEITADHIYNAVILEKYCPDSPGWAGDMALVVHGESCFKDLLVGILNPTNQKLNIADKAKIIRTVTFSIKAGENGINDNDIVKSIIVWAYNLVLKVIPFPFLKSSTYLPNLS